MGTNRGSILFCVLALCSFFLSAQDQINTTDFKERPTASAFENSPVIDVEVTLKNVQ